MLQGWGGVAGRGVAFPVAERRLHLEDKDINKLGGPGPGRVVTSPLRQGISLHLSPRPLQWGFLWGLLRTIWHSFKMLRAKVIQWELLAVWVTKWDVRVSSSCFPLFSKEKENNSKEQKSNTGEWLFWGLVNAAQSHLSEKMIKREPWEQPWSPTPSFPKWGNNPRKMTVL